MNEQNRELSQNAGVGANSDWVNLVLVSVELAEAVREERLSRVSMLRQLRTRFPAHSESELTEVMHQALEQVLRGSV